MLARLPVGCWRGLIFADASLTTIHCIFSTSCGLANGRVLRLAEDGKTLFTQRVMLPLGDSANYVHSELLLKGELITRATEIVEAMFGLFFLSTRALKREFGVRTVKVMWMVESSAAIEYMNDAQMERESGDWKITDPAR